MTSRFDGQVVVVTGGAQGIGFAAARAFVAGGAAHVVLLDRDELALESAVTALGVRAVGIPADLAQAETVVDAFQQVWKRFGRLNVLFANAGVSGEGKRVCDLSLEGFLNTLQINLVGTFLAVRESIRLMKESQGSRAIVTMSSSMAGWDVLDGGADYAASKYGVLGITRAAAFEAAGDGIRVNAVCPGVVRTSLGVPDLGAEGETRALGRFESRIPLGAVGSPEQVAATVCFLASEDASHITGAELLIDGGQTLQSWANAPHV